VPVQTLIVLAKTVIDRISPQGTLQPISISKIIEKCIYSNDRITKRSQEAVVLRSLPIFNNDPTNDHPKRFHTLS
ncbi:MAG: hypothetical protein AAGM67_06050, partial [Bacteroidota bacterium]